MSPERRQELLDLLLGELAPQRAEELTRIVRRDPDLQRELQELEALFGLMRRGDEIEIEPSVHASIMQVARRMTRPSFVRRLVSLPGLFRFRFQRSIGFRVAAISLAAHLVVVAVLWQFHVSGGELVGNDPDLNLHPPDLADLPVPDYRPDRHFVLRLGRARVSRSVRLKRYGVAGQRAAIRQGVDTLLARQRSDGSFGSVDQTAQAALVFLGEGVNSTDATARGKAMHGAVRSILRGVDAGHRDGFALSALIEDWVFSYERLTEEERTRYLRAIRTLIPAVQGAGAGESLILAELAGLPVSSDRLEGPLALVLESSADGRPVNGSLDRAPSRLSATALIARMQAEGEDHLGVDRETLRRWLEPAFSGALAAGRRGDTTALLFLQAPYRL